MDFNAIDTKWNNLWQQGKVFEANHSKEKKFFLSAAFPYPNSPQHIGHGRTYTTTDIYARYLRMQGYNVLFPMGFHVTGTPILAMAKRLGQKDEEYLRIFEEIYGISRETSATLTEPKALVTYFSHEIEQGMREMGYSIDWRRKFYSYDACFNKFIQWQFRKLKEAGYIKQGSHPVPWCPSDNNAVGAHDTRGDVDPQIEEVTAVAFEIKGEGSLLCSTYRPETVYGVTNIWINPSAKYVKVEMNGKKFIISQDAANALSQQFGLKIIGEIKVAELLKKEAINPLSNAKLPIFEAKFVEPKTGTGVVMSVPAHAPLDYLALRDAKLDGKVKLVQVLTVEGFGEFPAKEIVERMKVPNQLDSKAEEATKEIYKKEAHTGIMKVGEFAGEGCATAREKIAAALAKKGQAHKLYVLANSPVFCRCGALCSVKMVQNQWFLDYGDKKWKEKAKECLSGMKIMPQQTIADYLYTIDWLNERACTRAAGLGTQFEFDKTQMIEALSDSTIYMAFYAISHYAKDLPADALDEKFFDYVFLGKGKAPNEAAKKMHEEFEYWYPFDSSHSAKDLVHNHLVFFLFNHACIFEKKKWPKQIVTNGFVLMDGKKMSKSMGNIMPIRAAIKRYGADVIRFSVVAGADLSSDTDFNKSVAEGISSRIKSMGELLEKTIAHDAQKGAKTSAKYDAADKWFYSRLHRRVKNAPAMFESFQIRELSQEILFETFNDMQHYLKRAKEPRLREFFEYWTALSAPFMPHIAEEFWEKLGKKKFVKDAKFASLAHMPAADEKKIDEEMEKQEQFLLSTREDVVTLLRLLKKEGQAKKIHLFVADEWKREVRSVVAREKDFGKAIKACLANAKLKPHAAEFKKVIETCMKDVGALKSEVLSSQQELDALQNGAEFLKSEFGTEILVKKESEAEGAQAQRAKNAMPNRVAVAIE
ncbi:Leucine--tRNA ligase [Candidatus Anstonella stagnisolia]|nr:Leucine--tRNA ligase [Candidatus Anstonella stagnisolia]